MNSNLLMSDLDSSVSFLSICGNFDKLLGFRIDLELMSDCYREVIAGDTAEMSFSLSKKTPAVGEHVLVLYIIIPSTTTGYIVFLMRQFPG